MKWLEAHQRPSGGFLGSVGRGASYFPDAEPAWGVKLYLDAHRLRVLSYVERKVHTFLAEVSHDDGRARAILRVIRPTDRVIEAGCGKGRFLKLVRQPYPETDCTGVGISPRMLQELPPEIHRVEGSLESIPCPDGSFDVVFSVEAIEHAANPERAVAEMIRIARPAGWVVINDKQRKHWGRLACQPWERWPEAETLKQLLQRGCDHVTYEPVGYDSHPEDGLMLAWSGRKLSLRVALQSNATEGPQRYWHPA